MSNLKDFSDKEKALQTMSTMTSAQIVSVAAAKGISLLHPHRLPHHFHHPVLPPLAYPGVSKQSSLYTSD